MGNAKRLVKNDKGAKIIVMIVKPITAILRRRLLWDSLRLACFDLRSSCTRITASALSEPCSIRCIRCFSFRKSSLGRRVRSLTLASVVLFGVLSHTFLDICLLNVFQTSSCRKTIFLIMAILLWTALFCSMSSFFFSISFLCKPPWRT